MNTYVSLAINNRDLIMGVLIWPAITALMTLAFRKRTPEEWEKWALTKPGLAFVVEFCKANGWEPAKNSVIFQRYAQRKAGKIPEDAWERLPVSPALKDALRNPAMRDQLTRLVTPMLTAPDESPHKDS